MDTTKVGGVLSISCMDMATETDTGCLSGTQLFYTLHLHFLWGQEEHRVLHSEYGEGYLRIFVFHTHALQAILCDFDPCST